MWTENKAHLVQSYLRLFTFITHHGTYIDAFAGPQEPDKPDMWSAKLVLDCTPRLLRQFRLFEADPVKVKALERLAIEHNWMLANMDPPEKARDIIVRGGDCNVEIPKFLAQCPIADREATFALLDQRMFECHWETLRTLATHKKGGTKIELFYFLPNAWLPRAFAALKDEQKAQRWWGRDDWRDLVRMGQQDRASLFAQRIRDEFGYLDVKPWPINEKKGGGIVMYYMIHATDHREAPLLMARAFNKEVDATKPVDQLTIDALLKTDPPRR